MPCRNGVAVSVPICPFTGGIDYFYVRKYDNPKFGLFPTPMAKVDRSIKAPISIGALIE
jgi:hypothetical protein